MARDIEGRVSGAAAWSGDLATLNDAELHERIESLAVHIGNLHTVWSSQGWHAATPAELDRRELPRWIAARLAALKERDRRD